MIDLLQFTFADSDEFNRLTGHDVLKLPTIIGADPTSTEAMKCLNVAYFLNRRRTEPEYTLEEAQSLTLEDTSMMLENLGFVIDGDEQEDEPDPLSNDDDNVIVVDGSSPESRSLKPGDFAYPT